MKNYHKYVKEAPTNMDFDYPRGSPVDASMFDILTGDSPEQAPLEFGRSPKDIIEFSVYTQENEVLQYGQISGYNGFKESLAGWLNSKNYSNHQVESKELFIVNGVTGGLQFIINQYLSQDDVILVEEPSYFLAINIFKEYGLTIDTIPMQKNGLNLEVLEQKVRKYSSIQKNIFLYTIPTCHNPTGYTLNDMKRKQLASIATVYNNFYIIADEVYHFLRWDKTENILPMSDYHTNFISIGSFSKLLAPSLRVGWIYINSTHEEPLNMMPDFGIFFYLDKHRLNDFWGKDAEVTKPDAFYFRVTK